MLLEQLRTSRLQEGVRRLPERAPGGAIEDRKEFESKNEPHFAYLAQRWEEWYAHNLEHFERIGRDIPAEFAAAPRGAHPDPHQQRHPRLHAAAAERPDDPCPDAPGTLDQPSSSLGFKPRGCGCRSAPTARSGTTGCRPCSTTTRAIAPGWRTFIADAGVDHFFVDTHLITDGQPLGVIENGNFQHGRRAQPTGTRRPRLAATRWSPSAWRPARAAEVFAFAPAPAGLRAGLVRLDRLPRRGAVPGIPPQARRARACAITRSPTTRPRSSDKEPYYPDDVPGKVFEHAQHFCNVVRGRAAGVPQPHRPAGRVRRAVRCGTVRALVVRRPAFLRDVILTLSRRRREARCTAEEALDHNPPGQGRAHARGLLGRERQPQRLDQRPQPLDVGDRVPRRGALLQRLHEPALADQPQVQDCWSTPARELLLLQASDWPFVVHTEARSITAFSGSPAIRPTSTAPSKWPSMWPQAMRWTSLQKRNWRKWPCTTVFSLTLI